MSDINLSGDLIADGTQIITYLSSNYVGVNDDVNTLMDSIIKSSKEIRHDWNMLKKIIQFDPSSIRSMEFGYQNTEFKMFAIIKRASISDVTIDFYTRMIMQGVAPVNYKDAIDILEKRNLDEVVNKVKELKELI